MKIFLLLATTFCVSGISAAAVPKIEPEEQHAAIGRKPQQQHQQATPAAIARRQLPFSSSLAVTTSDSSTLNLNYTTISTTASPVITTTATAEAEAEAVANPAGLLKSFLPLPPLPLPPPTKCTPSSICVDKISICADFSRKRYGGYVDLSYLTFSSVCFLFRPSVPFFFFSS